MSIAAQLIRAVEANGGRLFVENAFLVIEPRKAGLPLVEQLREHKQEIIDLIQHRTSAVPATEHSPTMLPLPEGVRLIRWSPKAGPVLLSECSKVTDTEKFIYTTLWQLDAALHGRHWVSGNWGLSGLLDRLEACGCVVALDDPLKALQ